MSDDELLSGDEEQPALFEVEPDWKDLWQGMPEYSHQDLQPWQSVIVHFATQKDRESFAKLLGQTLHAKTKFIWHPKATIGKAADKVFTGAKVTPRYPVYIISKGRWESRLTVKSLEWIGVPYHIVVEPQELEQYAKVIDPAKILVTPFSNLGQGGIPVRNFVWEHSIATGAARHWILDDNISGFCRFQDNLKVELDNAATFCAIEDWVDRYENVMMAGFNYDYFAPRKQGAKIRPITLNTRIYSGILISNSIVHRWRGRYNEDTDLSLRILKDGHCTALFNAFLMYKKPTLTMKGGNTDQLYAGVEAAAAEWEAHAAACPTCQQCTDGYGSKVTPCEEGRQILSKDGRWLMAESLREQHPDVTTVERKWRRWQHGVDYRRFQVQLGLNVPKLREGVIIPEESEYELERVAMPEGDSGHNSIGHVSAPRAAPAPSAGPSALGFLASLEQPVQASLSKPSQAEEKPALASPQPESRPFEPEPIPFDPQFFKDYLGAKGHRLLTRDGKFFISESARLTTEDREAVKLHRGALIALAEPWIDPHESRSPEDGQAGQTPLTPLVQRAEQAASSGSDRASGAGSIPADSLFEAERPTQTLAQFLGSEPSRVDVSYVPDEPPDLTGIDEVVLNFATTGLNWHGGDRPCGVTVSTLDGQMTRFLPFAFAGGNLDEAAVKRWAERELRGKKITNANTRFDLHMARAWGIDLDEQGCTFSDVQHTAALLDDHRKRFKLDLLAEDYLPGQPTVARVDETRHSEYHAAEVAERERYTAQLVGRLVAVMYPELDKQELRAVQNLEDRVIPAVVEMEENGAPIDVELLERYSVECNRKHDELLWEVAREAGFAFDHTAKSWQRLFESLGLPPTEGNAEAVINAIDHPVVKKAHLCAQYASLNSKIFKSYKERVGSDGILRFELNQLRNEDKGTVSGRFSAGIIQQCPNFSNHHAVFGDELFPRRLYVPGSGQYLASDAAQIQYRIFASHAANPRILKMYADNPRVNFHRMIEGMIRPYKSDLVYEHVKSMDFMIIFGGGLIKLAVMMGFITDAVGEEIRRAKGQKTDPRLAQAREIKAIYDREISEVEPLLRKASHLAMTKCSEYCRKNDALHRQFPHRGYVKTVLGRRSRFPDDYRLHKAFCMIDQGSEGDILKEKIAQLHEARKTTGFVMRMTVHDEISGDALEPDTLQKVDAILNTQSFPQIKVPILFETKVGLTWAECK